MSTSKPPPDLDTEKMRQALVSLRVAFDDLDFVVEDLLRPHRQRTWGYVTHAEKHGEAKGSILQAWSYLMKAIGAELPDDGGGVREDAGPTH